MLICWRVYIHIYIYMHATPQKRPSAQKIQMLIDVSRNLCLEKMFLFSAIPTFNGIYIYTYCIYTYYIYKLYSYYTMGVNDVEMELVNNTKMGWWGNALWVICYLAMENHQLYPTKSAMASVIVCQITSGYNVGPPSHKLIYKPH